MEKRYDMVNWVDGMKIHKKHFVAQQHAFTQRVTEAYAAQLNPFNYGLLVPASGESASCKLTVELENTGTVHVKVFRCRALTPGGSLIDIGDDTGQPVHFTVNISGSENAAEGSGHLLALSVNPYDPAPAGEPDPEEIPIRHPYLRPDYRLSLLTKDAGVNQPGKFHLPIAEVITGASGISLNDQYIPPCAAVYSDPRLIETHIGFYSSLRNLETLCIQIIQKVLVRDQRYLLAKIVKDISESLLVYLGANLYRFNWQLRYEPPVRMVECIAGLGRTFKNAIDIRQGTGKEELINYFAEWCDLNQSQFEKVVSDLTDHNYDHTKTSEAIAYAFRFLKELVSLYAKLNELDYIGRKSEKAIFVKEEEVAGRSETRNRMSFWTK